MDLLETLENRKHSISLLDLIHVGFNERELRKQTLPKLITQGRVLIANIDSQEVVMLTDKVYVSPIAFQGSPNYTISTKLRKPCHTCPYRGGSIDVFETLGTSDEDYNGLIVHDCHTISDNYEIQGEGLGCLGSAQIAMVRKGYAELKYLKPFEELETTKDYYVQYSQCGNTLWIHYQAETVGRFDTRSGIDIHHTIEEQCNGKPQCLKCTHEKPTREDFELFCNHALEHWGVVIDKTLVKI